MRIFETIFQVLADIAIGGFVNFGLKLLVPSMSENAVIMITLVVTAIFAELVEMRFKNTKK